MFFFASNAKVDIGCCHNRSKGDPVKRVGGKMITIFSTGAITQIGRWSVVQSTVCALFFGAKCLILFLYSPVCLRAQSWSCYSIFMSMTFMSTSAPKFFNTRMILFFFCVTNDDSDAQILQNDLATLHSWSENKSHLSDNSDFLLLASPVKLTETIWIFSLKVSSCLS